MLELMLESTLPPTPVPPFPPVPPKPPFATGFAVKLFEFKLKPNELESDCEPEIAVGFEINVGDEIAVAEGFEITCALALADGSETLGGVAKAPKLCNAKITRTIVELIFLNILFPLYFKLKNQLLLFVYCRFTADLLPIQTKKNVKANQVNIQAGKVR